MPYNPTTGVYTVPAGTALFPEGPVDAEPYNNFLADLTVSINQVVNRVRGSRMLGPLQVGTDFAQNKIENLGSVVTPLGFLRLQDLFPVYTGSCFYRPIALAYPDNDLPFVLQTDGESPFLQVAELVTVNDFRIRTGGIVEGPFYLTFRIAGSTITGLGGLKVSGYPDGYTTTQADETFFIMPPESTMAGDWRVFRFALN